MAEESNSVLKLFQIRCRVVSLIVPVLGSYEYTMQTKVSAVKFETYYGNSFLFSLPDKECL